MSDNTINNSSTVNNAEVISNAVPRVASKKSLDEAIDMLRRRRRHKKLPFKRKQEKDIDEENEHLRDNSCIMNYTYILKRVNVSSSFTTNFVPKELTNALKSEDWKSVLQLFPMLYKCMNVEPFLWRYAFLIFLLNPNSDQYEFEKFFIKVLGTEANNPAKCNDLLQKLLSYSENNENPVEHQEVQPA